MCKIWQISLDKYSRPLNSHFCSSRTAQKVFPGRPLRNGPPLLPQWGLGPCGGSRPHRNGPLPLSWGLGPSAGPGGVGAWPLGRGIYIYIVINIYLSNSLNRLWSDIVSVTNWFRTRAQYEIRPFLKMRISPVLSNLCINITYESKYIFGSSADMFTKCVVSKQEAPAASRSSRQQCFWGPIHVMYYYNSTL